MSKPVEKRLYVVRDKEGNECLLMAASGSQAIAAVYEHDCHTAKPGEVARLMQAGVKIREV